MCGIVGVKGDPTDAELRSLFDSIQLRGRDGIGAATSHQGKIRTLHMVENPDPERFIDWFRRWAGPWGNGATKLLIMASRAQPLPEASSSQKTLQPFANEFVALVHNGTISNDRELAEAHGIDYIGVDTHVVFQRLIQNKLYLDTDELVGGFAFLVLDAQEESIEVTKNTKTLWLGRVPRLSSGTSHTWVVASEPEWIEDAFGVYRCGVQGCLERVPPYCYLNVGVDERPSPITNKYWSYTPDLSEEEAVVVTSGGIDSVTSAYIASKIHDRRVTLVHFDYGQLSSVKERQAVQSVALDLKCDLRVIDLSELGRLGASPLTDPALPLPTGMQSAESTLCWTPARNLLMVAYAAGVAEAIGAKWLYFGNNMEEEGTGYGDNDLDFVALYNELLRLGTLKGVQVVRSLARLMKTELLTLGLSLGVPYHATWSCDQGLPLPCGYCGCCTTRRHAFIRIGERDPQSYMEPLKDVYPWVGEPPVTHNLTELVRRVQL